MKSIIFYGLILICVTLSFSPKENSKSIINQARALIRLDNRLIISLILIITYLSLIPQLNEFEGELTDYSANAGYIGLVFGKIVSSIFFGVIVPYLISLFFSKERKGISFNITAIITNYICILTYVI